MFLQEIKKKRWFVISGKEAEQLLNLVFVVMWEGIF